MSDYGGSAQNPLLGAALNRRQLFAVSLEGWPRRRWRRWREAALAEVA
ncbi:MAG: hypothetical protein ABSD80_08065 [Caulobacteraceae bacterium]